MKPDPRALVRKVLGNPELFPDEFRAWIKAQTDKFEPVRRVREGGAQNDLLIATVNDGKYVKRSGYTLIGRDPTDDGYIKFDFDNVGGYLDITTTGANGSGYGMEIQLAEFFLLETQKDLEFRAHNTNGSQAITLLSYSGNVGITALAGDVTLAATGSFGGIRSTIGSSGTWSVHDHNGQTILELDDVHDFTHWLRTTRSFWIKRSSGDPIFTVQQDAGGLGFYETKFATVGFEVVSTGADVYHQVDSGGGFYVTVTGESSLTMDAAGGVELVSSDAAGYISINGSALGFFGVTPVAQPATPTTLADVIAALQALGLVA